jgi:hypothetical protein
MFPAVLLFGCASDFILAPDDADPGVELVPHEVGDVLPDPTDETADTGSGTTGTPDAGTPDAGTPPEQPCQVALPDDVWIVSDDTGSTQDGIVAFVCRNDMMSYSGNGGVFFLDDRGELVVSGDRNIIFAPANARIHNFGEGNRIVLEKERSLSDESDDGAAVQLCDPLEYDLGGERDPGCR